MLRINIHNPQVRRTLSAYSLLRSGSSLVCRAHPVEPHHAPRRIHFGCTVARAAKRFRQIDRVLLSLLHQRWTDRGLAFRWRQSVRTDFDVCIAFTEEWSVGPWKTFDAIFHTVQYVCRSRNAAKASTVEGKLILYADWSELCHADVFVFLFLFQLNVPAIFMQVALDEGPGPPIKHQYPELCKLHQVVSQLIRCSNISMKCQSSEDGKAILPNIYGDANVSADNMLPLSKEAMEYIFGKNK